jgi:ribonuclease BN (tRNA processing enzyme)
MPPRQGTTVAVRLTFLGSGDAFNARARCHAGYLLATPSATVLLDCGPTTLLAFKREGLTPDALDAIAVSHLHGDHFAGLPFVFLHYIFDTPRGRPLTVIGPPGTEARVRDLYRAMYRELSAKALPFAVRYTELADGGRATVGDAELLAFAVPHQQSEVSLGYRLQAAGKTVLYSGDTGWTEALVEQSRGTDLFICECCYFDTRTDFHLDYGRIAENRARFGCRRLVLTHVGREVHARAGEIREQIAHDGLVIDL